MRKKTLINTLLSKAKNMAAEKMQIEEALKQNGYTNINIKKAEKLKENVRISIITTKSSKAKRESLTNLKKQKIELPRQSNNTSQLQGYCSRHQDGGYLQAQMLIRRDDQLDNHQWQNSLDLYVSKKLLYKSFRPTNCFRKSFLKHLLQRDKPSFDKLC